LGKSHEIPQIDPWQTTVTERLGISDEIYAQGSILAVHWVGAIDALTDLKKADLLSTLEASAHAMPELPQDHNGRVLPRIEYAAKHIVYETHERGDVIQDLLEGSAKRVTPDFNQMETVLGELMEAYDNNMPPYNYPDTMTPQDQRNMPKTPFTDDRQKANFFLTSCLWMRRMNSVTAMQNLGRLFDATRDWEKDPFDPHVAADMSEDEMLAEVWSQEADVRMQSGEWLYSYMVLAYQPLSDADMAAYQAFSETAEGKILNRATFVAFDKLFTAISHDLGRAAAQQMLAQDI